MTVGTWQNEDESDREMQKHKVKSENNIEYLRKSYQQLLANMLATTTNESPNKLSKLTQPQFFS